MPAFIYEKFQHSECEMDKKKASLIEASLESVTIPRVKD